MELLTLKELFRVISSDTVCNILDENGETCFIFRKTVKYIREIHNETLDNLITDIKPHGNELDIFMYNVCR